MRWVLRHPPPEVAPGVCYGRTDLPLRPGWEGAVDALSLPGVRRVRTSPLTRCRRPAERLAARLGAELTVDADLAEMDFGDWEGRAWDDLPRDQIDAWAADLTGYRPPGGESVDEMTARAARAWSAGADLLVAHQGIWRALNALTGRADPWRASLPFGGLGRL